MASPPSVVESARVKDDYQLLSTLSETAPLLVSKKQKMKKQPLLIAVGLAIVASMITVVTLFYPKFQETREIKQIGAEWESSGKLPQEDYVKLRALTETANKELGLTDENLDWVLKRLGSKEALVRSRLLGLLELAARKPTEAQKEKIATAIKPFLASENALEKVAAQRVEKVLTGQPTLAH